MEATLGRVINPDGVGKQRSQLIRGVVLALRELASQNKPDNHTRDIVAFIVLALSAISNTIEQTVSAWEKRGYWLKADRFRLDWMWAETYGAKLEQALLEDNWPDVAVTAAQIAEKLRDVKVPKRNRLGTPWIGAWDKLNASVKTTKRVIPLERFYTTVFPGNVLDLGEIVTEIQISALPEGAKAKYSKFSIRKRPC